MGGLEGGGFGRSGRSEDERVVFILPVLHIFLGGMSIVCKNEPTPAGGYTKEKRAKERAEEDEKDGGEGP